MNPRNLSHFAPKLVEGCDLGITLGRAVFTDLDYADDAVLFAQDPGRWQAELKRFDDAALPQPLSQPLPQPPILAHFVGKDKITEHWLRTSISISLR